MIYRNKIKPSERPKIDSAKDAYQVFRATWDLNKIELLEQFKIILLTKNNKCLGISEIATGGTSSCPVDPKIVFTTALKAKASAVILAHNHPSGNLSASGEDINVTSRLVKGGKLLDIAVLDHLIVTEQGFFSLAEESLMPG